MKKITEKILQKIIKNTISYVFVLTFTIKMFLGGVN